MQRLNDLLTGITQSFGDIVPELILATGLLIILTTGLFNNRRNAVFNILTLLTAVCSFTFTALREAKARPDLFNGMLSRDGFTDFLTLLVDISVILTCLMSLRGAGRRKLSEYYALILAVALGSHLLLMSTNLLMVFLSLELISISSYVLAGYAFNKPGSEGSLKYFLFGSVASAVMLYGFTLLYGLTGTLKFDAPGFFEQLTAYASSPLFLIAGLMGLAGFLFKMAAVPMQPWAPDVYQAAPMPVIAYLSVGPKLAGIGILVKFLLALHLFGESAYDWQLIVAAISIVSITVGNFSALWQKNPKRMMAYSSIAHSGFLLVGIAAFMPQGISFMLFYACVYLIMNFAVFVYLDYFEQQGIRDMKDFSGAGKAFIWAATGLTFALVALTGLPPTGGFTAKLFIFSGLWEAYVETGKSLLIWLLVFGLLNTVISLFFYFRIPYYAFIKTGTIADRQKNSGFENFLGMILVVILVGIFFLPGLLMGLINRINFVF